MPLFIPTCLFGTIGGFFLGLAGLFTLLAGLTLRQFRRQRAAEQVVAARQSRLEKAYLLLMAVVIGMTLLVALGAFLVE